MSSSRASSESPLIMLQPQPAELKCLLRFSLLSLLVHAAALAILLTWTSESAKILPLIQVITIDLSQMEPSSPPAIQRIKSEPVPKPLVRTAPAPARITAKALPLPAINRPLSFTPAVATPNVAQGSSVATSVKDEPSAVTAQPGPIIPTAPPVLPTPPYVPVAKPVSEKASVRAGYMSRCRELIEHHKEYPVMARKGRIEGTVVILGTLSRDGSLRQCVVNRSSRSGLLDNAAIRAVRSVDHFPPVPPELHGEDLVFELPISFRLTVE